MCPCDRWINKSVNARFCFNKPRRLWRLDARHAISAVLDYRSPPRFSDFAPLPSPANPPPHSSHHPKPSPTHPPTVTWVGVWTPSAESSAHAVVSRSARSEVQGSPVIDELKRLGMENIFLCDVIVQCVCVRAHVRSASSGFMKRWKHMHVACCECMHEEWDGSLEGA